MKTLLRRPLTLTPARRRLADRRKGLGELAAIAGSIRRGEGSLGKLVQDDSAYHDLIDLTHRGEHSLTALDDNLTALKQTWPLSRYFDRRAYLDRERVPFSRAPTQ